MRHRGDTQLSGEYIVLDSSGSLVHISYPELLAAALEVVLGIRRICERQFSYFGRGAPLRMKMRWQHMNEPVKDRAAGTSPSTVQRVSVMPLNLPI